MNADDFQKQLEVIHTCLEQKVLLLTNMLNITKEIEVQSMNEDMFLDDLLARRGNCIERYERCNALIKQQAERIKSNDENYFNILTRALLGEDTGDDNLAELTELAIKGQELFERTKKINEQAQKNLLEQREKMKEELSNFRNSRYNTSNGMFH